jgi:hypothetical protein
MKSPATRKKNEAFFFMRILGYAFFTMGHGFYQHKAPVMFWQGASAGIFGKGRYVLRRAVSRQRRAHFWQKRKRG